MPDQRADWKLNHHPLEFVVTFRADNDEQNWNFGAREHCDTGTRFAQGSKALRLLHLY